MDELEIENWTLETSLKVANRIKTGDTLYIERDGGMRVRVMVTSVDIDSILGTAQFTCIPTGDID